MLFYRAALPLSRKTLHFVAGIIRRHRAAIGSLSRTPGRAAQHPITHGHPVYRPAASNTADAQAARHRRGRSDAGTTLPLRTRPVP